MDKLTFKAIIISIQPRIRLIRSFDEAIYMIAQAKIEWFAKDALAVNWKFQ